KVEGFVGEYDILSNYSNFEMTVDGMSYSSLAFAHEASRFKPSKQDRVLINGFEGEARLGEAEAVNYINGGWGGDEMGSLRKLLRMKFNPEIHPENAEVLLKTGNKLLVAYEEPGSTIEGKTWGVDKDGWGYNVAGVELMKIR